MSSFDDAFKSLIENEGGYSNHPSDPGGETMYGITYRVARAHGYTGAMKDLPLETARTIAKEEFWDPYKLDLLNPVIAFQVFDAIYNGGHAIPWLQTAVGVTPDGVIGPKTLAAANSLDPDKVIMRFDAYRISYLAGLPKWPTFGKGWMIRVAENLLRAAK